MKKLIIDSRIRDIEYEFLSKYFDVIKLPLSNDVYEEISGHSDIFYAKINDKIICAPNSPIIYENFKIGYKKVGNTYPDDVLYNVCQIGDKVIGSKYADKSIKPQILVKQGYVKCSIAVTGNCSCITTDKKIAKVLQANNIDASYIEENNIKLLKTSALSIEKEIKKENEKLNKLYDFLENGIYSSDEFISRSKAIKETIKKLEEKSKEFSSLLDNNKRAQEEKKSIIPKLENVIDLYYKLDTAEDKNILLKSILAKVTYLKTEKAINHDSDPTNFELNIYPKIPKI